MKIFVPPGDRVSCHDGPRSAEAVHRGADDPSGIAGPFTAGVKTRNRGALAGHVVARDADGRAPRDSGPVSVASSRNEPRRRRFMIGMPRLSAAITTGGRIRSRFTAFDRAHNYTGSCRGWFARRRNPRPAGSARDSCRPPARYARRSARCWKWTPASGCRLPRSSGADRDDQAAVGERRIAAALAHAVGAEVAGSLTEGMM